MSTCDEGPTLSPRDAFLAMAEFVWRYGQLAGDDLITLIGDTGIEPDGMPTDPAAWEDWLACVAWIRAGNAPRSTPRSEPSE